REQRRQHPSHHRHCNGAERWRGKTARPKTTGKEDPMPINTSGNNPTTLEASGATTTTSLSDALKQINDSIVGKVDSGATVDGFGLELSSTLPGSTISVTNDGTVTSSQNNRALFIVPGAAGAFGTFTYSGAGSVTNTSTGGALLVDNQGAGNVDITIS